MNTSRTFLALAALALAGGTVTAHAQDMNAVRQRMEQRLSSLDALKDKGLVGENNRGYLEARGALSPADSSAVADEDAARGFVYAAIARQTGSNSDQVGRARAQKLVEMSKAGVWVQRATGEWARK